jgi:murein DD-endopeptidase MepM/ murein hydrolase activator NlpD
MALTEAWLRRSRDLWIKREKTYRAKAADAHNKHKHRSEQLAAAQAASKRKVAMPVRTDMAKNTNGWNPPGHDGIDLLCAENAPLFAVCKSRVVRVSPDGWWGNNPRPSPGHPVSDGDGIIILESLVDVGPIKRGLHFGYGHGEHATVKVGDVVEAGQVIGKAGWAVVPHVHFMVNDDAPVNGLYRGVGDRDPRPVLDFVLKNAA